MSQLTPPSPPEHPARTETAGAVTPVEVLRALTAMAARSRRRQADVGAALRGAGLPASGPAIDAALALLLERGFVADVIPLSDGGMLLMVTSLGTNNAREISELQQNDLDLSALPAV
jgi:hypothetical protein